MRNLVLDSVRLFHRGELHASVLSINQFFRQSYDNEIISINASELGNFADSLDWDFFIERLLIAHWTQKVGIGLIYKSIWEHFPTKILILTIARFDTWRYRSTRLLNDTEILELFAINELFAIIHDGCASGKIQNSLDVDTDGFLPIIDGAFFEVLKNEQSNQDFSMKIQSACQLGFTSHTAKSKTSLVDNHFGFLVKYLMIPMYFPPENVRYIDLRFREIKERFPKSAPLISQALRNQMDSIPDADELADFIFLYTGGQVLPEDPRAWMRLFIQSVETGKMLIPEI